MNIPQELMDDAYKFTYILSMAMSIIILYNLLSGAIRALGDSKTPLYFLIISSLLNIAFNFIFIKFLKFGVQGSALGTLCSISLSAIACILFIYAKYPILKLSKNDCKYNHKTMKKHLRVAIPMAIQFSILSIGLLIIQSFCNSFGTDVIAGFTAAMRIEQISTQPLFALGIAFATYSAQNFGAFLIKRIRQGVRQCLFAGFILSIIISLIIRIYGINMISIFIENKNSNIIEIGQKYLLLASYFYFPLLCIFIVRNAIQGMGKTFTPVLSSIIELIARILTASILANKIGYMGVFWSGPIAWTCGALVVFTGYIIIIKQLNPITLRKIFMLNKTMKK
jgi:Na+-driven multidrug efflux pump